MMHNMNETQVKVAQRMKFLNDPEMSHMDKLREAVGQNRDLTEEQLLVEVYEVQRLAGVGTAKVRHAAQYGRNEMSEKMAAATRKECVDVLMNVIGKINEWSANHTHDELNLPDEVRAILDEVYGCIARQEPVTLVKEELVGLTLALTEQYCMMVTAEHVGMDNEVDADAFEAVPANGRCELVMAVAMNLKATGKIPAEIADLSNEDYAGMVCAMDAVNGYCADAAKGKITMGELFKVIGNICMGVFCMVAGLMVIPADGVLMAGLAVLTVISGWFDLVEGVKALYKHLIPAGLAETRVGRAVVKAAHTVATVAKRIMNRVVRMVREAAVVLVNAVKVGARKAKEFATETAETAKVAFQAARDAVAYRHLVIH